MSTRVAPMTGKLKIDMSVLKIDRMVGTIVCDDKGKEVRRITEQDVAKSEAAMLKQAQKAIKEKDGAGFMLLVGNEKRARHLWNNLHLLRQRGMYGAALFNTFTTYWNNAGWRLKANYNLWSFFFSLADRKCLRKCGDPLPHPGPFTVYRGVSGRGKARRVKGYSWTGDINAARWFAGVMSYGTGNLPDPAVFVVTVPKDAILFYTNERNEDEYVLSLENLRPRRIERVTRDQYEAIEKAKQTAQRKESET